MKPSQGATVSFDCDTEEEEERHHRGTEKRKKRSTARKERREAKTELAEPESDEAAQDERIHNQYTFGFWWKVREEELNAVYEKAVELNEKAFFASLTAFAAVLMIQLRMAVTDETALSRRHPKRSLDCILKARTDQPDYNVWNFLDVDENSEYDVREPEAMLLKNFRKTRAFAWMIVGVEYLSTDASEIETISPTLRDFRKRTTDHVGDILYANQFPRIPTGETARYLPLHAGVDGQRGE